MKFEKWQALGNDYLIVENTELSPERVRALCDRHRGPGADGVLELGPPAGDGAVARLRIFNPDGSEAELSGNGVRQAVLYLRRAGWTDADTFAVETAAGVIRPTITGPETARVDMGVATDHGTGEIDAGGRTFGYRQLDVGNPQCAIEADDVEALDVAAIGPEIERAPRFPNRTNVSFWRELEPGTVRARIFERGVGETLASGTGATGAAIAYVIGGGASPVTVRLDGGELAVDVGEDLRVHLTGWARPVYRGELIG